MPWSEKKEATVFSRSPLCREQALLPLALSPDFLQGAESARSQRTARAKERREGRTAQRLLNVLARHLPENPQDPQRGPELRVAWSDVPALRLQMRGKILFNVLALAARLGIYPGENVVSVGQAGESFECELHVNLRPEDYGPSKVIPDSFGRNFGRNLGAT